MVEEHQLSNAPIHKKQDNDSIEMETLKSNMSNINMD